MSHAEMITKLGLETQEDLHRVSLALLKWAIEQIETGKNVTSYNPATNQTETYIIEGLFVAQPKRRGHNLSIVPNGDTDK